MTSPTTLSINLNRMMRIKEKHPEDFVKAGVARTTLYRTRYQNAVPKTEIIVKMADVLGVRPTELLNRQDIVEKLAIIEEARSKSLLEKGFICSRRSIGEGLGMPDIKKSWDGAIAEPKNGGFYKESYKNLSVPALGFFILGVSIISILTLFKIYI